MVSAGPQVGTPAAAPMPHGAARRLRSRHRAAPCCTALPALSTQLPLRACSPSKSSPVCCSKVCSRRCSRRATIWLSWDSSAWDGLASLRRMGRQRGCSGGSVGWDCTGWDCMAQTAGGEGAVEGSPAATPPQPPPPLPRAAPGLDGAHSIRQRGGHAKIVCGLAHQPLGVAFLW